MLIKMSGTKTHVWQSGTKKVIKIDFKRCIEMVECHHFRFSTLNTQCYCETQEIMHVLLCFSIEM